MEKIAPRRNGRWPLVCLLLPLLAACPGDIGFEPCAGPSCEADDPGGGLPGGGSVGSPINQAETCSNDDDCMAPYVCHLGAGRCVPPSAKENGICDPIEGISCPARLSCINGVCQTPPTHCQSNDECPAGTICQYDVCTPDNSNGGGCLDQSDCPAGSLCVAGDCVAEAICNVVHAPDRLHGAWRFDSQLQVRDGLRGLMKGVLSLATTLQSILEGRFQINGMPSILSSLVGALLRDLIAPYVPPWGRELISWLAELDDAIDTWRVQSVEGLRSVGDDQYVGSSQWLQVSFEYKGAQITVDPRQVPAIGAIAAEGYTAREICGKLVIDRHPVENAMGKIFRWAIEAMLMAISCNDPQVPCFQSLDQMFEALIDCRGLGTAVAAGDPSLATFAAAIEATCVSQKSTLVTLLRNELDDLALNLTYMSLQGKADIPSDSGSLQNGRWYGVLGGLYGKGNFEGSFSARR